MITVGTYHKQPFLLDPARRSFFCNKLFQIMLDHQLELQAWAVLSNHYHIIVQVPENNNNNQLRTVITELNRSSAVSFNRKDGTPGRKIWHNYWDSHITFHQSYLARLHYVHINPVHHGIVPNATLYPHCSYAWFEQNAVSAFRNTVLQMKSDNITVHDDY